MFLMRGWCGLVAETALADAFCFQTGGLEKTATVQKKGLAPMASSTVPTLLSELLKHSCRGGRSSRPHQILHGVPKAKGQRTGQRCKPIECSNGGTMRVSLTVASAGCPSGTSLSPGRASSNHLPLPPPEFASQHYLRLGGRRVRKARNHVADSLDGGDVCMSRDSSIVFIVDLRRRLKGASNVLDGLIRTGVSLSR